MPPTSRNKILAAISHLIYEDWEVFEDEMSLLGYGLMCDPFDIGGSQGALLLGPEGAVMGFRGTEASKFVVSDILSNFGYPRRWEGPGRVHSGYLQHFRNIRVEARAFAERVSSDIPLYVTGHSMGGSLATLYAAWVASGRGMDHRLAGLVTFGAPKALSKAGLKAIACPCERIVNRYDFAQYWPPIPGLSHPEVRVPIDSGGWPGPVSRHASEKYVRTTT